MNDTETESPYIEDHPERPLSDVLASHRQRLDRIESKLDDITNRLTLILEILR